MKLEINPNLKFDQPTLQEKYRKAAMSAVKTYWVLSSELAI